MINTEENPNDQDDNIEGYLMKLNQDIEEVQSLSKDMNETI